MKPPAFNPESFFTELPDELRRRILNFAVNGRLLTFKAGVGAIQSQALLTPFNIDLHEQDLRTIGALRATNKGHPHRTFTSGNRFVYYNFVLEVWAVRNLSIARCVYNSADFPHVSALTLDNLYKDSLRAEHQKLSAIRAATQKNPDAMKRALRALRQPEDPEKDVVMVV